MEDIKVSEVITDHIDEDNYQYVDVYKTEDRNEGGKTVAVVCLDTNKVFWIDTIYMLSTPVKEAIEEIRKNNNPRFKI